MSKFPLSNKSCFFKLLPDMTLQDLMYGFTKKIFLTVITSQFHQYSISLFVTKYDHLKKLPKISKIKLHRISMQKSSGSYKVIVISTW